MLNLLEIDEIIQLPTNLQEFIKNGEYHMPENTPDTSVVNAIKAIGEFCYLIVHPKALWCRIVPYSKVALFSICLISLCIYAATKNKKAGKVTLACPFIYLFVRYLDLLIQGGK